MPNDGASNTPYADNIVINNRDPNKPVLKRDIHVAQIGDQSNCKNCFSNARGDPPKVGMALGPARNVRPTDVRFVETNRYFRSRVAEIDVS